jgi:16S rRNA (cytidine1402-2'-O)-methyltransferase
LLNKDTTENQIPGLLKLVPPGKDCGVLSNAGCPCIADPGALLVKQAQMLNYQIIPMIGPSSIIMSLMASGFNGQNFAFQGYLPMEAQLRKQKLQFLEKLIRKDQQTQIFIESPHRNHHLFQDILTWISPDIKLCVALNVTLPEEWIKTKSVVDWKTFNIIDIRKKPCIFLLGK